MGLALLRMHLLLIDILKLRSQVVKFANPIFTFGRVLEEGRWGIGGEIITQSIQALASLHLVLHLVHIHLLIIQICLAFQELSSSSLVLDESMLIMGISVNEDVGKENSLARGISSEWTCS
jgi:hypothetical protein